MSSRKAAAAKARPASSMKPKGKPVAARPVVVKPALNKPSLSKPSLNKPSLSKPSLSKPSLNKPRVVADNGVSADAIRLADEIERAFAKSDQALSPEAMQKLMTALCRVYAAQVENGAKHTPIPEGQAVSPTGVMVTASGLLRAANLAVFELGMWQSWTGK